MWMAAGVLAAAASVGSASAQAENGAFQFRAGVFSPSGGGEFFDENEEVFTFDASDLTGGAIGATYLQPISPRWELGWNLDFSEGSDVTRYRDIEDEDGFPILHDSRLSRVPVTVDLRFLPGGRYAARGSRGQYAARRPIPYLGAGIGANFWRYEEEGDFVDFGTNEIFTDEFVDRGVAMETHVLAGLELPVGRLWSLALEGRYSWSDDELSDDFEGLGKIVMDGGSAFLGFTYRY
jgi:hypothetical protein